MSVGKPFATDFGMLEWYRTGRLAMHKKPTLGGSDVLTYSGDPIGFTIEFDLYLFLFTMGALGVLMACRDILLEVLGPQYLLDLRRPISLPCALTGFSPVAF